MKALGTRVRIGLGLIAMFCGGGVVAAQTSSDAAPVTAAGSNGAVVPQLVKYSGVLTDAQGNALSGVVGVTFSLYQEQTGGAALWSEIQNVQMSKDGHYTVTLGSTTSGGLPQDVFANGEARWLGVQVDGQAEKARVLLAAVPYALKARDAETIGGLPASAFMLANGGSSNLNATAKAADAKISASVPKNSNAPVNPDVTGKGVVDYIPMWDTTSDIVDSVIFQKTSEIGIGTTAPAATLDVNGKSDVRDTLTLFPKSTDNTLAVSGTTFKINNTGAVTFVSGQTFPGTGTITGVTTASGSGLIGGGTTGTLALKVPAAGITNTMLASSKVTLNASTAGGLTVPGAMTLGDSYTIGLKACASKQVLQYNGTSWACAAAGTGTVTSVASGSGLTGGPITGSGTLSIANAGVTNAMLAHPTITLTTGSGLNGPGTMTLGNSYNLALTTSCATNQVLQWNGTKWACSSAGSGTVTSVASGTGLTGGPITGSGTLSINTTVIPQLAAENLFTNTQVINENAGDGIDITATNGYGLFVESAAYDGVVGYGNYDGGFFSGSISGTYSETQATESFDAAAYGYEYGSSDETIGVYGWSASGVGIGVYGVGETSSSTGANTDSGYYPMGLWGDSGEQYGFGAFGSADDGWAFVGYNNSPSGFSTIWLENQESTSSSDPVLFTYGSTYGGECTADVSGNFSCTGSFDAVAPVEGGAKKVALNGIASPEHWFEDAGSGQLTNGETVISIESVFGETVNTGMDYHVFLTPNGDCKGLYVAQKSATSFVVRELGGGTSSIAFDYRIMAKRRGFEQARLTDKTQVFSLKNRPVKPAGAPAKRSPNPQDVRKKMEQRARPHSAGTLAKK
jgi:hypothetical protein